MNYSLNLFTFIKRACLYPPVVTTGQYRQHRDVITRAYNRISKYSGFTLLELLTTVAVVSIVLSLGVPNFQSFVKNNRLRTQTNLLVLDINYARSEAIKRGEKLVLCRSINTQNVNPTCSGTAKSWSAGWLLFVSNDANNSYDSGTDILLKRTELSSPGITFTSNSEATLSLLFNGDGSKSGTAEARFAICDDRGTAYGRVLTVTNTGRAGLSSGSVDSPIVSCSNL